MKKYYELDYNAEETKINECIHLAEDTIIVINNPSTYDEITYLANLSRIIRILKEHNKTYTISIQIDNRELLIKSGLLNIPNIDFNISCDESTYSKEEFLAEDEELEEMVSDIKNANLSPYEKFLAVYDKVKMFRNYNQNHNNTSQAKRLKYILQKDWEYISCAGFSNLLTALLNKVGISSYQVNLNIEELGEKEKMEFHARNIVMINDDKYNIHGVYVSDATGDNGIIYWYNYSTMTFDRTKEAICLESLEDEDLLLDFHGYEEFNQKIAHYLKRKLNREGDWNYDDKLIDSYDFLYNAILKILYNLDYDKYKELYDKYNGLMEKCIKDYKDGKVSFEKFQFEFKNIFNTFLKEYADYIIPLSNKTISKETMLAAITCIKRKSNELNEEDIQEEISYINKVYDRREEKGFPYMYDPNNPIPNYLENRSR